MWAQLISMHVKPGKDGDVTRLIEQLHATEGPGSGLLRSTAFRDEKDPSHLYFLVVFESEEKARAREQDPVREKALEPIRALMGETFDGPPEFVDLGVISEHSY